MRSAREWVAERLGALPVEQEEDEAGNRWATLRGASERALLIGGHADSVPGGGWLDGVLGLLAGLEVLRRIAAEGTPPVTVRLVDWADEEGARFGRSLFGSSCASGTLEPEEVRGLRDGDGVALPDALAVHGVELERVKESGRRLEGAGAYLELHIEQGSVLESLDLPLGVVLGTFGVERHLVRFRGQSAHAGSTPMDARRDAFLAAARFGLGVRDAARREGGVGTVGRVVTRPGVVTAVPGECELTLDQRHLEAEGLAGMLAAAGEAARAACAAECVECEWEHVWSIEPVRFDPALVDLADEAVREVAGEVHRLPSGPLHDAAEVARAGIPTVMLFVQSLRGLSHTKEEDTRPEHLELSVAALDRLATKAMERLAREDRQL
jgi:N-carbamoyl-L-amino-acid hydrolase